jgi:hypothetical protein
MPRARHRVLPATSHRHFPSASPSQDYFRDPPTTLLTILNSTNMKENLPCASTPIPVALHYRAAGHQHVHMVHHPRVHTLGMGWLTIALHLHYPPTHLLMFTLSPTHAHMLNSFL